MNKILVICGPTATGKTALALTLAKKIGGELVSADSRQVYRGMDIGTGKDIPTGSENKSSSEAGYYLIDEIRLWGYDLADPRESFSVSQYSDTAEKIIGDIFRRKKLPILIGGTGFYIKSVIDGIATANVPPDESLRRPLSEKTADELFDILSADAPQKAALMNESDRKNPRRLIRAIEIARAGISQHQMSTDRFIDGNKVLFIGLMADKEVLDERIKDRVLSRVDEGQEEEIRGLLKSGVDWQMQSMQTLGYREWRDYFDKKESLDTVIKKWTTNEIKYAKRQMTWFKKDKRINWFDTADAKYKHEVENLVRKWQNDL